jgi:hypothetical protein
MKRDTANINGRSFPFQHEPRPRLPDAMLRGEAFDHGAEEQIEHVPSLPDTYGKPRLLQLIVVVIVLVLAYGIVGNGDYDDAIRSDRDHVQARLDRAWQEIDSLRKQLDGACAQAPIATLPATSTLPTKVQS